MQQKLFTYYTYGPAKQPLLSFAQGDQLETVEPVGRTLTLTFDTTQRFCTGWHDLATGDVYPCPDNAQLPSQYHECRHCQLKTGFNPAFYHTDSISPQQQARNQEPHFLYLAHFAPGVVKVGISYAQRGIGRLLDQGARSYLKLKTFPTAQDARHFEASIALLPSIAETLQGRIKYQLLNKPYDAQAAHNELLSARQKIEATTELEAEQNVPESLDKHYLSAPLKTGQLIDLQHEKKISGRVIGMVGDVLIAEQDDAHFFLPLSKLRGYKVTLSETEEANQHAPQQASLF